MTVTLELNPEVERRVAADADARGQTIETYLVALIEVATTFPGKTPFGLDDFEADMDALSEGSDALPVLAPDAFSRENIYADHA